jgi:hypothetical protein
MKIIMYKIDDVRIYTIRPNFLNFDVRASGDEKVGWVGGGIVRK